ncbi:MAG: MBL fold metallo-hydrolase [Oscillibacter sp.]|jgi:L-ascorbate metabolism protein UlaG (beta-lactamase superfamily)|nr:MBL fold metallo-hydrolase [Oscillibacter sp.]
MLRVTFLGHSGFAAELPSALLLFDWWTGELPALPADKPLFCLVSHRHPDHFNPRIFALDDGSREVTFLLGKGIRLTERNFEKWGVSPAAGKKCVSVRGGETLELGPVHLEALSSTDEGAAYVVRADGKTLYHAGDLNWWHWDGESDGWNRTMELSFKRYLEPLRRRRIDAAFAPLDPRQGAFCARGFQYLLELAEVRRIFPMHQWGDTSPTARFCEEHPALAQKVLSTDFPGQSWELP